MQLARDPILPGVAQRVHPIAPVAHEVEPVHGRLWVQRGAAQTVPRVVVRVGLQVEGGVPEGPVVGRVVEEAPGEDVFVEARGGVGCVGALCGVDDGLFGASAC